MYYITKTLRQLRAGGSNFTLVRQNITNKNLLIQSKCLGTYIPGKFMPKSWLKSLLELLQYYLNTTRQL